MINKERVEISRNIPNELCATDIYGEKKNGKWVFTDLRTCIKFELLNKKDEYDYTNKELTAWQRLINYKLSKTDFDLDYCKSVRKNYKFRVVSDLYEVLWKISMNGNIDSGETLVSPDLNIARCRNDIKKRRGQPVGVAWKDIKPDSNDEDLENFAKSVATIGNFMAVPTTHQKLLALMQERYDKVLHLIRAFYLCYFSDPSIDFIIYDEIKEWLEKYLREDASTSWKNFVDCNFLRGSFVNEEYDVNNYDGTLNQLSQMIYNRSVVMIQEYEKRRITPAVAKS